DLVRHLEQHAALVARLALRRVRGPGGVARGEIERSSVFGFRLHPAIDALGKTQLGEFAAEQRRELGGERRPVEAGGLLGAVFLGGAALHEQPLGAVERRQPAVPGLQRGKLGGDAEQLADEVVEHGRELDDQLGLRLARDGVGGSPSSHQPAVQAGVAALEQIDEGAVEAHEAVAAVQIRKPQLKAERQAFRNRWAQRWRHNSPSGNQRNRARPARPAIGKRLHDHAALNRSITAAGTGMPFSAAGLCGSRAAHTRVSLPSTASSPSIEIRWATSKLERRNSLTCEAISATSLNLAGLRNRALASTSGMPTMPNAVPRSAGRTPSALSNKSQTLQSKNSKNRLLNTMPAGSQ